MSGPGQRAGADSIQRRLSFDSPTKPVMGHVDNNADIVTRGLVDALDNSLPTSHYPAKPAQWSSWPSSTSQTSAAGEAHRENRDRHSGHNGMTITSRTRDPPYRYLELQRRSSSLDTFHQVGWRPPLTTPERSRPGSEGSVETSRPGTLTDTRKAGKAWNDKDPVHCAPSDVANESMSDIGTGDKDLEMAFAYLPRAYKPYYSDPRGAVTYVISNPRSSETVTKTVVIDENKDLQVYDGVPKGITPDATVRVGKHDFLNCVNSTLDPFVAYMVGKVKVDNVNRIRTFGNNFEFDEEEFTTFQNEWREAQEAEKVSASQRGGVDGDEDDDDSDGDDGSRFRSWSSGFQRLRSRSSSVSEDLPGILDENGGDVETPQPGYDPRSPFFNDRSLSRVQEALTDSLDHLRTEILDLATQDLDKRQTEVKESLQALRENAEVMQRELVDRATGDAKEMEQLLRTKWSEALETIRREIVVKAQKDSKDIQQRFREGMQDIVREIKQELSESTRDNAEAKEFIAGIAQSWHQKVKDTALDAANTTKSTSSSLLQYFDQKASSMQEDSLSSPKVNSSVMINLPKPAPVDSLNQRVTITPTFLKEMLGKTEQYQQRSEVQVIGTGVISPAPQVRDQVTSPEEASLPPRRARLSLDETMSFLHDLRELAGQGATDFQSAMSTYLDRFNFFTKKTTSTRVPRDQSLHSNHSGTPVIRLPGYDREPQSQHDSAESLGDGSRTPRDIPGLGPMRR